MMAAAISPALGLNTPTRLRYCPGGAIRATMGYGYFAALGSIRLRRTAMCSHSLRAYAVPCAYLQANTAHFWGLCPIVIHISEIEIDEALRFGDAFFTDIGDERSERVVRHIEIVERSE